MTSVFIDELFSVYPVLCPCRKDIELAYTFLLDCAVNDGIILSCGNGGSASDSEHITGELMKGFLKKRPLDKELAAKISDFGVDFASRLQSPIRAVSLSSQTSLISAAANDIGADLVFAQQVLGYVTKPFDILFALSTSGNSRNVFAAAVTAKAKDAKVITVCGKNRDNLLSPVSDCMISLPADEVFRVQELTVCVYHALCAAVEDRLFPD